MVLEEVKTVSPSPPPLLCLDTQEDLKRKTQASKLARKNKRIEKEMIAQAQVSDAKKRRELIDAIEQRSQALHEDRASTPMIVPGNPASKLAYGRKKTHAYNVDPMDYLMTNKERVPYVADIAEADALRIEEGYRESLGLENVADHFLPTRSFLENRPENQVRVTVEGSKRVASKTATVSIQGDNARIVESPDELKRIAIEKDWSPAMASAMEPALVGTLKRKRKELRTVAANDAIPSPVVDGNDDDAMDVDMPSEAGVVLEPAKKKPRTEMIEDAQGKHVVRNLTIQIQHTPGATAGKSVKKAAPVKLSRTQMALTELSGKRQVTAEEAQFLFVAGEQKNIKAKQVRYEYLTRTETPPSGNANVRAARRDYMTSTAFAEEADRGVNQATAAEVSPDMGALESNERGAIPTVVTGGLEMRNMAVVDEDFYEPDEPQSYLLRKGDKLAIDMAKKRYNKSLLPRKTIDTPVLRELEQGRDPNFLVLENARLKLLQEPPKAPPSQDDGPVLPLVLVNATDVRQPLYRYFEIFGKTECLVGENIVEELVFDYKRMLFNCINTEQIYKRARPTGAPDVTTKEEREQQKKFDDEISLVPDFARVDENGMKIMHKSASQRARNIKRQREQTGRQAESEPQRLRARIADSRIESFLERWNRRDAIFASDYPDLIDPSLRDANLADAELQRQRRDIHRRISLGVLGQLLQRHRTEIRERGDRTGTAHFVSSEELGSSRLHPSVNTSLEEVSMAYILASMEQPGVGEDCCTNNQECYCYKGNISWVDSCTYFSPTNNLGFICKAWRTPNEDKIFRLTGVKPVRRPCIVCTLEEVTRSAYAFARTDIQVTQTIQPFRVKIGKGEYSTAQCIPLTWRIGGRQILTGIIEPFPMFNESDYLHTQRYDAHNNCVRFIRYHPPRVGF